MPEIPDSRPVFLKWWDDLPPQVSEHLAVQAVLVMRSLLPGVDKDMEHSAAVFRNLLEVKEPSRYGAAGRLLALASAIDFAFAGHSTKEDWEAWAEWNRSLADHMEETGHADFAEKHRRHVETFRLRGAMWEREAERWEALRAGPLSAEVAYAWVLSQPLAQLPTI